MQGQQYTCLIKPPTSCVTADIGVKRCSMATDASLRPKWIAQREQRKAYAVSQAWQVVAQEGLAEMAIEKHSVQFCLDFLRQLQFNLDCLDGLDGTVRPASTPDEGPQVYSTTLRGKPPLYRAFSGTIQFSRPHTNSIRILPVQPDGMKGWHICLAPLPNGDGVGGVWAGQIIPLSADRIAELIAEKLADYVDPPASGV